jgi:hypothetical protein
MIVVDKILRLISTKFFFVKDLEYLVTPSGVNFNIFYQLLCQELGLYSTRSLQNRRLTKERRDQERNRLMAVHAGLDMAENLFEQHQIKLCPEKHKYQINSNNICIHKKHLNFFAENILLESLNIIEVMGSYKWQVFPNKPGMWREYIGDKLIPIGATIMTIGDITYIKLDNMPHAFV